MQNRTAIPAVQRRCNPVILYPRKLQYIVMNLFIHYVGKLAVYIRMMCWAKRHQVTRLIVAVIVIVVVDCDDIFLPADYALLFMILKA